jgi:hypothetical protein
MIATAPTQEQVDQIALALGPDVVRIRVQPGYDWSDRPANYFRITLSDEASGMGRLGDVVARVREKLSESLGLWESNRIPYFRFRSQSEQAKMRETAWE